MSACPQLQCSLFTLVLIAYIVSLLIGGRSIEKIAAKRKADTDAKIAAIEQSVPAAKEAPAAPKPRLGFDEEKPKDMFEARVISKKEEEKLQPQKKTKLDKIDKSGMKSLSSFFKRKSV